MGRVWRVRDVVLDVPVALKVVRPDLAADPRFRKLFDVEVRTAARFTHQHIVPLHDSGELPDGTPFLGLALAEDGNFATLRTEMPVWEEILRLTLELLDALSHLHAHGVLHRDLKPENVLLARIIDGRRHVWLADLGLANASAQLARRKGRIEGTPGFMAPEQRLGLPREYGPWTDLYSIGVILWEMVTGSLPFPQGRTPMECELPPLIPQPGLLIPERLELILANLLDSEPLSRYDLAADLRTELLALGWAEIDADTARARAKASNRILLGTVAPSAPTPQPVTSGYTVSKHAPSSSSSSESLSRATISFFEDEDSDVEPRFQLGVPAWNRPRGAPMPPLPEPEPGLGATARGSLALFAMREIPLVGRDAYRDQLWEEARQVAETGLSRVVLLVGETGAGKSRVADSVVRALEEGGHAEALRLSYTREHSKDDGYPGAARAIIKPWKESRVSLEARLRRRLARERGALDAVVSEEAATLCRWAGLLNPDESPVAIGFGLREVYRYLEARSWRGVSVLVLDDVQWSDEDSDGLSIAETVLQGAADGEQKNLLVMATIQLDDLKQDKTLRERVEHLVSQGATRIDLPRLTRDETRDLLAEYLTLTPDLADKVARRCEGNPLFARQLLLDWANRGWLVNKGGLQYALADGVDADAVLPSDASALFRQRLTELADHSGNAERFRNTLHGASLIGESAPKALLTSMAGQELYSFLLSTGVWVELEEVVRFDHGLMRQTVLEEARQRPDVHRLERKLANAWIGYGAISGQEVDLEVGRHAHAGQDYGLAVKHLIAASENAWRRGKTRELELAADLAVECVSRDPRIKNQGGWPRIWRARAHEVSGDAQSAGDLYYRARILFQETHDEAGIVEAYIGMGWSARQLGKLPTAERRYTDAMKRARALGSVRQEAQAIAGLAWVEQGKRNFEGADILFTRVLNRFNQLDDLRGQAEATLGQAIVARRTGNFDDAEELYVEAVEAFQEGDDLLGVARAVAGRGVVARQRLQLKRAEQLLREAIHIAEELGATPLVMECRVGLGDIARIADDHARARRLYTAYLIWAERQNLFEQAIVAHLKLAQVALAQEDLSGVYEHANAAAAVLEKVQGHWLWAPYRLLVATMLALRGDHENTYRWLWSAQELGLGDTVDHDYATLLTVICHVAQRRKWTNALRVAGKLAVGQWDRLEQPAKAEHIRSLVAST